MRIRYNEDAEVVARLRAALLKRDLQCPCRLNGWVNHSSFECSAGRAMMVLSSVP